MSQQSAGNKRPLRQREDTVGCLCFAIYLKLLTYMCALQLEWFTMCMLHSSDVFSRAKLCRVGASSRLSVPEVMSQRLKTKQTT